MNSSIFDVVYHMYKLICSSGTGLKLMHFRKELSVKLKTQREKTIPDNLRNITIIRKIKKSFLKSGMLGY